MKLSIGIIETKGMVAALQLADEIVKTAYVDITGIEKAGSGLVAVIFAGDLCNVNAAFEAGVSVAEKSGRLVSAKVIAKPFPDLKNHFKTYTNPK